MDWIHDVFPVQLSLSYRARHENIQDPVQRRRNIFGLKKIATFSSDEFLRLCHNRNLTLFKRENIEG